MRQKLIAAALVLVLSLSLCAASYFVVLRVLYQMEDISMQALELADHGDLEGARQQMTQMAYTWEKYISVLEMLTSHEDLHAVVEHYVEASANLQRGHLDDYYKTMALLGEMLKHIRDQESPRWSNLF